MVLIANWNPNGTATKGAEWFARRQGSIVLDGALKNATVSMDQSAAEATGWVKLYLQNPTVGGLFVAEVFDNETAVAANVTSATARPNEDVSGTGSTTGAWREDDDTTTTIYSEIDEVTLDRTDYIYSKTWGAGPNTSTYRGRMGTAAINATITGKRILAVTLAVEMWSDGYSPYCYYGLNVNGTDYGTQIIPGSGNSSHSQTWLYNPDAKRPWRVADVDLFDTTDEWYFTRYGYLSDVRIYQAYLEVHYCDENRLAVGVLDLTAAAGAAGWREVAMTTPTGGAWTKDAAGQHTYLVRRLNNTGTVGLPYLDAVDAAPPPGDGWNPVLDPTYGYATSMGDRLTRLPAIIQRTTVPADSADSLPYAALVDANVYTGVNAEQEFQGSVATYGAFRCLINPGDATADLTITCKRRSDNVSMLGTITVTAAQANALRDLGSGWRLLVTTFPSPAALAAVQYYIQWSSTAATAALGWNVMALDVGSAADGVIATFGGTTDRGTVNSSEADRYDLPFTLATIPTAPTNFAVALGAQTLAATTICGATSIPRAQITWTATGLGANFSAYEIQRSQDSQVTWETIALLETEATASFYDYEAKRGVAAFYRMRVVRTDEAVSAWTTVIARTKPVNDSTVYLVSNYTPTLNCAYDCEPERELGFLDADELVLVQTYQRDYQLGFVATEVRGMTASYTLVLGIGGRLPASTGNAAFDALRAIAHAALPYVCVLDHYGGRQFAALAVPDGNIAEPAHRYIASMHATDVTATPYAVTV